jgi:hypothetical protein
MDQRVIDKFWASTKKQENDCWLWIRGRDFYITLDGKVNRMSPHRVSYEIAYGTIPKNMTVQRTCGNPACVKPEHLILKSISEVAKSCHEPNLDYLKKFWERVEKQENGCWNWTGHFHGNSPQYSHYASGIIFNAKRLSLELSGRSSVGVKDIYQSCNNKKCINPDHLLVGDAARFWNKVIKTDGCWIWTGQRSQSSLRYGKFNYCVLHKQKTISAHRFSYLITYGSISEAECVRHTCDNPICVRPDHLIIGTQADNINDKVIRNRQAKGESHGSAKLNSDKIREIRTLFSMGKKVSEIADLYQMGKTTVSDIIKGRTWKHVI